MRTRSELSLRGVFDDGFVPRGNLPAERIGQAGAPLRIRGAGVGVPLLDNLLRVDLARGIGGGGWRLHLRMGGGPDYRTG